MKDAETNEQSVEKNKRYPGDFPECDKCALSLRQCYRMTACEPVRCEIYLKYLKG